MRMSRSVNYSLDVRVGLVLSVRVLARLSIIQHDGAIKLCFIKRALSEAYWTISQP